TAFTPWVPASRLRALRFGGLAFRPVEALRVDGSRGRTVDSLKRALTWPARWPHTTPALRVLAKPRRKRHLAQRERSANRQNEEIQSAGAASADASGNP